MKLFKKQKELKELTLKAALAKIECLEKEQVFYENLVALQQEKINSLEFEIQCRKEEMSDMLRELNKYQ